MSEGTPRPVVVVTGANGFVGSHVCDALSSRGATVRAVVRRPGTAPDLSGVREHVGEFGDPAFAADVVAGADAVVTTVHPMGSDLEAQHAVGVEHTTVLARAARDAGVARLVHVSTAAVYDRSPDAGDVDETSALVDDDAGAYPVTKRDADRAIAEVDGLTRVLVRPPAILGRGESSVWNSLRPAGLRDAETPPVANASQTFAWVHVGDLAALIADVASGRIAATTDADRGPVEGGCTAVNAAAGPATAGDYWSVVARFVGREPTWEEGPAWTGQILATRAAGWGWKPAVDLDQALRELADGLA